MNTDEKTETRRILNDNPLKAGIPLFLGIVCKRGDYNTDGGVYYQIDEDLAIVFNPHETPLDLTFGKLEPLAAYILHRGAASAYIPPIVRMKDYRAYWREQWFTPDLRERDLRAALIRHLEKIGKI